MSVELECAGLEGAPESSDELAAEDSAEYLDGQEEGAAGKYPTGTIGRETAGGDYAVDMRMNWTMRVADHGGWAEEMVAIWRGYRGDALERVVEDSPFVDVVRRWIGVPKGKNVGGWASPGEIHHELKDMYGRDFAQVWKNPAVFGRKLKENFSALRILGIGKKKLDGSWRYCFTPTSLQVKQSEAAYKNSVPSWQAEDAQGVPDLDDVL
jgi:hypothetical protein